MVFHTDSRGVRTYRAPGRTEIIGNHCDHQNGRVIAAAIDRYVTAEVEPNNTGRITLRQEGHPLIDIDLSDTLIREEEKDSSPSLVRGIAAYLIERGYHLRGFSGRVVSHVPVGSGVSSSAAYEILIGRILTDLSDEGMADPVTLALAGFHAENHYFGKPSGLMDQMAVANGGLTYIDFADPKRPENVRIDFDVEDYGYRICLVSAGSSHSDLTDEYASIPNDMKRAARCFGKSCLREVDPDEFMSAMAQVRREAGDRAVLRAVHFFDENERVLRLMRAIEERNIEDYLRIVRESGDSSCKLLQNIYPAGASGQQSLAVALMVSEKILGGKGAVRVHGGGFAGTIQAYVPLDMAEEYETGMQRVFGPGCCHFVSVSS